MRMNRVTALIALTGFMILAAVAAVLLGTGGSADPGESVAMSPTQAFVASPLIFEENRGQTDPQVDFLARGNGIALFLTSSGYVMELCGGEVAAEMASEVAAEIAGDVVACDVVRMSLVGAEPEPEVTGLERLPGVSNYLIGGDRDDWHTGIPQFARVGYASVYPGVDLVFYGNEGRLEYDFLLLPGADPAVIRLAYSGATDLSIDDAGNLVVSTSGAELVQQAPVVYQESKGARSRVHGEYALLAGGHFGSPRLDLLLHDARHPGNDQNQHHNT